MATCSIPTHPLVFIAKSCIMVVGGWIMFIYLLVMFSIFVLEGGLQSMYDLKAYHLNLDSSLLQFRLNLNHDIDQNFPFATW